MSGALVIGALIGILITASVAAKVDADEVGFDPSERYPGGDTTHRRAGLTANAFSRAAANLSFEEQFRFKLGNAFFRKLWVSAPASTRSSDGLGPLYNARACLRCHLKDGRGHPPDERANDRSTVSLVLKLAVPPRDGTSVSGDFLRLEPEPRYGHQLQDFAILGHLAEGRVDLRFEDAERVELSDGDRVQLRRPVYDVANVNYGPLDPLVIVSPRVAPPVIGLGLLELIPEPSILSLADPSDRDGDGISGRPHWLDAPEADGRRLGRFGWKAAHASLSEQNQGAFFEDMGISTALHNRAAGACTASQVRCRAAPSGSNAPGRPEAEPEITDLVLHYTRHLSVPPRRRPQAPDVLAGKRLFATLGCAKCHHPSFVTETAADRPALSGQRIWPYTDLLLHDMGPGLADRGLDGRVAGREWRTAPLWGIGLTEVVSGHTRFLHDGRAKNLTEAILWHGGEASASRDQFASLSVPDRALLLAFLNSL
ncbi:MAG: di-heme oxidoredictase family protein [Pseudomonadota bacterium]